MEKLFLVTYASDCDRRSLYSPPHVALVFANDAEDAVVRFFRTDPDNFEGWVVRSVDRPRTPSGKVDTSRDKRIA